MSILKEPKKNRFQRVMIPHDENAPIVKFNNVSYMYDGVLALKDISFELLSGVRLAVVGPNGAGKSTMFKIIAGLLQPTKGDVDIYGHQPRGHICIAYVPQRNQVDWNFPVNVLDVVMMGRIRKLGLFRWPNKFDREIVNQALQVVEMTQLAGRRINELSGGQQQRMFIARALAQEAELILMDEPLSGLDMNTQEEIFKIIDELHHRNVTIMVALHDLKIAAERFDQVLLLNRELLGLGRPEEVLEPERLMNAYGGHLRLISTDEGFMVLEDTCCDEGVHEHS